MSAASYTASFENPTISVYVSECQLNQVMKLTLFPEQNWYQMR